MSSRKYWLMKSEPDVYSIDDLERDGTTYWDGVRNYQARNFMRDEMKIGDQVLYYHSNTKPPGIVGIAEICKESYPDHTQFDPENSHFDPKSDKDDPRWLMVDLAFKEKFSAKVELKELKDHDQFEGMYVIRRGMRLSVQPVEEEHFQAVVDFAKKKGDGA